MKDSMLIQICQMYVLCTRRETTAERVTAVMQSIYFSILQHPLRRIACMLIATYSRNTSAEKEKVTDYSVKRACTQCRVKTR